MPTVSPEPERAAAAGLHQRRATAESFGADAQRYDRARPRYPTALVHRILDLTPPAPGPPHVLDVGCGTGIVARQLQEAGCRVLGVEPDPRMADLARRSKVAVEEARFEQWEAAGRTYDAVVAGQAWHWVDPVAGAAGAARALRPGGLLAPFWNAFELPPELADAVAEACRRALPDAPFDVRALGRGTKGGYGTLLAGAADGIRATGAFEEPQQWRHEWEWRYTRDAWLDQLPTQGAFTRLPAPALAAVLEGVGAAVDALGGSFTMRYATVAVTALVRGDG
ncbi:class I SAM-dependent methyltransferase [Streptomyces sp. NPDC047315]|uniref:class I SAM-dependent methyltransferase n=1 Tax=Streptomyces sp. NPDC047315 TaxID=3155142 RepID=UPI0033E507B3